MTDSAERNRTVGIEAGKAPARFRGKYLRVTSYRRDGTPVATPVWFVQDGAQLLAETGASSYKVRRIRANPAISVVACSASGRPHGTEVPARAEILGPEALEPERALMKQKYGLDRIVMLPIYRLIQRVRGRPTDRGDAVVVSITPDQTGGR